MSDFAFVPDVMLDVLKFINRIPLERVRLVSNAFNNFILGNSSRRSISNFLGCHGYLPLVSVATYSNLRVLRTRDWYCAILLGQNLNREEKHILESCVIEQFDTHMEDFSDLESLVGQIDFRVKLKKAIIWNCLSMKDRLEDNRIDFFYFQRFITTFNMMFDIQDLEIEGILLELPARIVTNAKSIRFFFHDFNVSNVTKGYIYTIFDFIRTNRYSRYHFVNDMEYPFFRLNDELPEHRGFEDFLEVGQEVDRQLSSIFTILLNLGFCSQS